LTTTPAHSECLPGRIPAWLKLGLPDAYSVAQVARVVSELGLGTVCFEAGCPNKGYCFARSEVTFLIMGTGCTRACGFCKVTRGRGEPLDAGEPERLAAAVRRLGLDHVVVTSVTRDDLPDGGAAHFEACVRAVRRTGSCTAIEVLTPDFGGCMADVETVARSGVDVFGHNIETVERLCGVARDGACYRRSLAVLRHARRSCPEVIVKSGLMLGMGETLDEVKAALRDLAGAGCEVVTVGQYMRPTRRHLPVKEYVAPAAFDDLSDYANRLGLVAVCGPRVRSSFGAGPAYREAKLRRQRCA
jgi:lipoic acid synthetase